MNFNGQMYKQIGMEQLFSEYPAQQSEFDEFFASEQWQPSSPSFSTSSPEFSPLVKTGSSTSAPDKYHDVRFPTLKNDDIENAKASSSIFSSTSSTASMGQGQTNQSIVVRSYSGFKACNSVFPPSSVLNRKYYGRMMIKDSIALVRKINLMKDETTNQEPSPSRNQLHHVISERKQREKLNESLRRLKTATTSLF